MKRKLFGCMLLLALSVSALVGSVRLSGDAALNGHLVRLHVIASSDSPEDQAVKLKVRDAILKEIDRMSFESIEEAVQTLSGHLEELGASAQKALRQEGISQRVQVRLCTEEYPVRDYGTFSLPAGEYVSLQVKLGEAQGQNWWCVVYPGLCHATNDEAFFQAAEAAGLSDGQIRLMRLDSSQVQFRFKLLELLQKIKNFF